MPFLLMLSAPLFDNRHPRILEVVILLSVMAGALYLPFMALYVGLRDHLLYRRLVKELRALGSLEGQP